MYGSLDDTQAQSVVNVNVQADDPNVPNNKDNNQSTDDTTLENNGNTQQLSTHTAVTVPLQQVVQSTNDEVIATQASTTTIKAVI
jgi:hypothetical protein